VLLLLLFTSCKTRKKASIAGRTDLTEINGIDMSKRLKKEVNYWMGVPYKYAGTDRSGVDCSSLVAEIYRSVYGIVLPRTSGQQYAVCRKVTAAKLKEGDLVFFNPGTKTISHVGIFLGEQKFIHASVSKGVVISNLDNSYYKKYFVSGGRF